MSIDKQTPPEENKNTYDNVKNVLTEIYGTKFYRRNWINNKEFRNVEDILKYNDNNKDTGAKYITMYNIKEDKSVEFNKIFIDFDITTDDILAKELELTESEVNNLSLEEKQAKIEEIERIEKEKTSNLSETALRKYYYNKFENRYFINPVNEAKKTAQYLKENFNVDVILNASGSKGVHLRILLEPIPITNPSEVLKKLCLFLQNELNLVTIDQKVMSSHNRLERIPTSKHEKTKLYANFFNLDIPYIQIIDNMEVKKTMILPAKVDRTTNTNNGFKDLLIKFDKEASEEVKTLNESISGNVKYSFNGTEEELANNFSLMWRNGHKNNVMYAFIHLLRRSRWNKEKTTGFISNLKILCNSYDRKHNKRLIDTAYDINLNNPKEHRHLGGLTHFIQTIETEAPTDKVEILKDFFINYFSKDKYAIWNPIKFKGKPIIIEDTGISFYYDTYNNEDYYLRVDPNSNDLQFIVRKNDTSLEIGFGHKGANKTIFERHKERPNYLAEDLDLEGMKADKTKITKYLNEVVKTIRTNEELTKIFNNDKDTNIINQVRSNPTDTRLLIDLSKKVETEFNIKRHINQTGKGNYYYNNGSYFKPISADLLGTLIENEYDLRLPTPNVNTVLSSIQRNDKLNRQILQFNNCYLDRDTLEEVKPNESDIIVKKIGVKDLETDTFILLDYDKTATTNANISIEESHTYTEKVLKQILIPKEDVTDTTLYVDRLERFGANVTGRNKFKCITMYWTRRANSGKSVFSLLNSLIFNDYFSVVNSKDLVDSFNYELIGNKHILVIDETTEKSLNNCISELKLLRSPNPRKDYRVMYGANKLTVNEFGNVEIYTNDKPNIPITEEALFYSIDLLELPNTFLEEKQTKKVNNAYIMDAETYDNIKKDCTGLSWLVSASINTYKTMISENRQYTCRQSTEETINKFINADNLLKFMALYTELDTELINWNTNNTILQSYKNYLEIKGITDNRTDNQLAIAIGNNIKTLFKDTYNKEIHKKRTGKNNREYALKIKSIEDVEKEFKEAYIINENLGTNEIETLKTLTGDRKTVYNAIKNGTNTYNKVNSKFSEIDTVEIFRELVNLNLILKSNNLSISEF